MKLNYFDLISPNPISIKNLGNFISPTLRQISEIGINTYHYYLSILMMDKKTFYTMLGRSGCFEEFPKTELNIFDLLVSDVDTAELLRKVINFFIVEDVIFYKSENCFLVTNNVNDIQNNIVGSITCKNYNEICDLIFQLNNIKLKSTEDLSKVRNKKALDILKKIQKGRIEKQRSSKVDKNMELGNIISAVANKHPSLNMVNIWDLTVYQLWDTFARLSINSIYDIQSMSVAAWGNKDNHFDATTWFKRTDTDN